MFLLGIAGEIDVVGAVAVDDVAVGGARAAAVGDVGVVDGAGFADDVAADDAGVVGDAAGIADGNYIECLGKEMNNSLDL